MNRRDDPDDVIATSAGFAPLAQRKPRVVVIGAGFGGLTAASDSHGVFVGDDRIEARNVFWATGVAADAVTRTLA